MHLRRSRADQSAGQRPGSVRFSRSTKCRSSADAESRRGERGGRAARADWLRPNGRRRLRAAWPAQCCPVLRERLSETAARLEGCPHRAGREVDWRDRAGHAEARDCRLGSGLVRGALLAHHARRGGVFERRNPAAASLRPVPDAIKEWPPRGDRYRGPGGFRAGHPRLRSGADPARALPHQSRPRRVCRRDRASSLAPPSPIVAQR